MSDAMSVSPTLTVHAPHRARAARVGVSLLIIGDGMFVASLIASDAYLSALNIGGSFHPASEAAPSVVAGLLLTAVAWASAAAVWWARRRYRRDQSDVPTFLLAMAWGLILVALIDQIWFVTSLAYASPLYGYASTQLALLGYHAFHLLVTAVVGGLLVARLLRRSVPPAEHVVDAVTYWWTWVAISALVLWLAGALIR